MTSGKYMKAIRIHQFGGIEELRYEEAPIPAPAAGEILIKVASTAFNPVDATIRMGYLQAVFLHDLPYIPNLEVSGTMRELVKRSRRSTRATRYMPSWICTKMVPLRNMLSPKQVMLLKLPLIWNYPMLPPSLSGH
jgi:D-arabinose 1-dehydrogenase-like Zn-dependent alcohol dehydrogenase